MLTQSNAIENKQNNLVVSVKARISLSWGLLMLGNGVLIELNCAFGRRRVMLRCLGMLAFGA
jgi:hypothetical protein